MATILDGNSLASLVQGSVRERVAEHCSRGRRAPGLGVILVGENPASKVYVARKEKVAKSVGFQSFEAFLNSEATADDLLGAVRRFNEEEKVDGILLQLPLPPHLDSDRFIEAIDPRKDADGLTAVNQGRLVQGGGGVRPCTPLGILRLIDLAFADVTLGSSTKISDILPTSLAGKKALVIGRSLLVGRPVSLLLLERDATVTIAHSKSPQLPELVGSADVVVAAIGRPEFVKGAWIKPGAVVIDVGINRLENGRLVGDVEFGEASKRAAAITPVPGGVGPMTVAMLMWNTLRCYETRFGR